MGIDLGLWRRSSVLQPAFLCKQVLVLADKVIPGSQRSGSNNVSQDRDQGVRSNRSEHFPSFARRLFHGNSGGNNVTDPKTLAHLLKYDSILGNLPTTVTAGCGLDLFR